MFSFKALPFRALFDHEMRVTYVNSLLFYWLNEKEANKANKSPKMQHNFHLVRPSPWPLVCSIYALGLTTGAVLFFHKYELGDQLLPLSFLNLCLSAGLWWRDVIREGTFEGRHTKCVQGGLRYGMIFFIISEVMFFSAFFWAFFHASLSPSIEVGCVWPPVGLVVFSPWEIPLLNTVILLLSGATITWAHHSLVEGNYDQTNISIASTVGLAIFFTCLQACEYLEAHFNISDGIYGSVFYMATGFHGFHVIVGTVFILVCGIRHYNYHFSRTHHLGFECAAWYWHFVDVVWLFLYLSVYWWGNS